ncbi:ABC transporter permease [Kineococcus sp. SYSU DK003]|uniref:ABC transporter permease n=1 Tax=Kineococcus sp. SYSU DK003 TaxID=3383124 RepID=UPI003D7D3AAD
MSPVTRTQAVDVRSTTGASSSGWKDLLTQPVVVVLALTCFLVWRSTADLSDTQLRTLGWDVLRNDVVEHLRLTFTAGLIVLVVALPLGIAVTRPALRRLAPVVETVANFGQAAPAVGLLVLLAMWLGIGFWPAVVALVLYALLPILRNTVVGLQGVDPRLVEAGRGMGMSAFSVLLRVELPLAVPVVLSGLRSALVLLVGTAALAPFVSGGGLGSLVLTGINLADTTLQVSGAVLVALLALVVDWLGRVVEHVAKPKGL